MNKRTTIIISVFVAFVLGAIISYLLTPTTEDILYTVLDDSSIESHIINSYLDNGNLIIDIYNPNCEIVKVKPATIEHHVTADMDSVKIFNYTDQYFEVIVGNASDVYTFGSLTKTWDAKNKAVTIKSNGMPSMTVRLISSEPNLCTFTEIFEVTNFETFAPHKDKDFKARTVKHKGKKDVTNIEWFIEQNISYVVNVTDYNVVQIDTEIYNNITGMNKTISVNETVIAGCHDEIQYKNVWQEYTHHDKPVPKDTVQRIKVVYHKSPELGDVKIQTIPLFRGVECDELTWWNTSWHKRVQLNVNNSSIALTDYQLMKNITYDSDMQTDFDDLRFTNDAGTVISYWIESKADSTYVNVWLKIPSISTTTGATVWMYYGNPDSSSASNGNDTFEFFDDFPGTSLNAQWNQISGTPIVSGGILVLDGTDKIRASGFSMTYCCCEFRAKKSSTSVGLSRLGMSNSLLSSSFYSDDCTMFYKHVTADIKSLVSNEGTLTAGDTGANYVADTYYNYVLTWLSGEVKAYVDDVLKDTHTTNTPNEVLNPRLDLVESGATTSIEWYFIRKYTATEPTWAVDGSEENAFSITSYAPTTPVNKLDGESQYFNVTTDVNCQCRWYINGTLKQTNTTQQTDHNYTNTSLEIGYFNFSAVVNTSSSATDTQTWWVTVSPTTTYIPPPPVLSNTTGGDFWANFTWTPGSGNTTDSYNVSYNDVWDNGTTTTHRNESVSGGGWHNITVCAWNSSGVGTPSNTCAEDNIEAPSYKPPEPINLANTTGNFWVNHTWQADSGNVTDYWNVSVNDVWYNRSYAWYNDTYLPHGWQNISVWAWNNTAQGTMSD